MIWEDEPTHTLGAWLKPEIENVPGKPKIWHSGDRPYLYHTLTGRLFLGEEGAYHADMGKDEQGKTTHPAMQQYWDWEHNTNYGDDYEWLRGRFNEDGIEHYDRYGLHGQSNLNLLEPHFQAIENALNTQQVEKPEEDWTVSHTLGATEDQVMYVPGMFHKGILGTGVKGYSGGGSTALHIWPLQHDPQWGLDPDAHPYHDEYARDNGLQRANGYDDNLAQQQTRIYVDPEGKVRGYPTNGTFMNHTPEQIMQRVQQHIPHAEWTTDPQPIYSDVEDDWKVSHTLGSVQVQHVDTGHFPNNGTPWIDDRHPFVYVPDHGTVYISEQGAHHGYINQHIDELAQKGGKPYPYGMKSYEGMLFTNPETSHLGYNIQWWNYPPADAKAHVENAVWSAMPQYKWGDVEPVENAKPEEDWSVTSATNTLQGELHIALDVPERIRLQIARWVESLDIPRDLLVDPAEYHITLAYASEGVEKVQAHEIRNNFNLTGLKFTGKQLSTFEGGALVIELENPYFSEWADHLADYLEDKGVDVERYDGGPKPHITIAYEASKSAPLPPISFRCGGLSISTPRSASQTALGPYTAHRVASPPATPPPWTPGTWGKGLFFDAPEGPQMSAWTTGTQSLVGGTPHHNQVAEGHHGIEWGDMISMMRGEHPSGTKCYLLKVQPDGVAYECAMGHSLPPSFDAVAAKHGIQRHPSDDAEYARDEDDWAS